MEVLKYSIKLYREEIGRKYPTARVWFSTPEGEDLVTTPLGFEKFPETTEEWPQLVKETIICKYDEAFTEKEMLEETGFCKCCELDCPNAGKSNTE